MANEIQNVETGVIIDTPVTPNYNKKLGDKVLKISIKCRKVKAKGITFLSIKGLKYLPVILESGENVGKRNRWLDIHFTKEAFKNIPNDCDIHSSEDLATGFLYVKAKYVQSPKVYEITEKLDEDGNVVYNEDGSVKLEYPSIWIKGGIVGFEEYVADQDEFDYHEAPIEHRDYSVDEETGEIIENDSDEQEVKL